MHVSAVFFDPFATIPSVRLISSAFSCVVGFRVELCDVGHFDAVSPLEPRRPQRIQLDTARNRLWRME